MGSIRRPAEFLSPHPARCARRPPHKWGGMLGLLSPHPARCARRPPHKWGGMLEFLSPTPQVGRRRSLTNEQMFVSLCPPPLLACVLLPEARKERCRNCSSNTPSPRFGSALAARR